MEEVLPSQEAKLQLGRPEELCFRVHRLQLIQEVMLILSVAKRPQVLVEASR
jgi:hypothetical protein